MDLLGRDDEVAGPTTAAPSAALRLDGDGTVLAADAVALGWLGREPATVVGALRFGALLSTAGRTTWETQVAPVLHLQRRVDGVPVELLGPTGPVPVLLSAVVRGFDGATAIEVHLVPDVGAAPATGEGEAAHVLDVLARVADRLAGATDVGSLCGTLVDAAVADLGAGAATVWLVGADGALVERATRTDGGRAPARPPAEDLPDVVVAGDGTVHVALQGRTGAHGVLSAVPRTDGGEPLDLDAVGAVGQQAGIALERALLHSRGTTAAAELADTLLTTSVPHDPRLDLTTVHRPGGGGLDVAGDWYDAFVLEDGTLALVVGDVVGRGLEAATAMGQLRSAVRSVAGPGAGPARVLARLDRFVEQAGVGFLTTLVYAELDVARGRLRYAAAGHLPPLRVPGTAGAELLWQGRSTPLGVAAERGEATAQLDPGDVVVLYTDGLLERRDRTMGDGLRALTATADRLAGRADVADALARELAPGADDRDDLCLLAVSWFGAGDGAGPGGRAPTPPGRGGMVPNP